VYDTLCSFLCRVWLGVVAGKPVPRRTHDCNDGTILWPTQLVTLHVVMIVTQTPGWAATSQLFASRLIQTLAQLTVAIGAQPSHPLNLHAVVHGTSLHVDKRPCEHSPQPVLSAVAGEVKHPSPSSRSCILDRVALVESGPPICAVASEAGSDYRLLSLVDTSLIHNIVVACLLDLHLCVRTTQLAAKLF
jgi:hypothetical protein